MEQEINNENLSIDERLEKEGLDLNSNAKININKFYEDLMNKLSILESLVKNEDIKLNDTTKEKLGKAIEYLKDVAEEIYSYVTNVDKDTGETKENYVIENNVMDAHRYMSNAKKEHEIMYKIKMYEGWQEKSKSERQKGNLKNRISKLQKKLGKIQQKQVKLVDKATKNKIKEYKKQMKPYNGMLSAVSKLNETKEKNNDKIMAKENEAKEANERLEELSNFKGELGMKIKYKFKSLLSPAKIGILKNKNGVVNFAERQCINKGVGSGILSRMKDKALKLGRAIKKGAESFWDTMKEPTVEAEPSRAK